MPKLTLRDLFWLVLVVAMGCAWSISFLKQANEIERLSSKVEYLRGELNAIYATKADPTPY